MRHDVSVTRAMISTSSHLRRFASRRAVVTCALGAVLAAGCNSSAPPQNAAPAAAPPAAAPASAKPSGPRIYVSDEQGRDVVVIDVAAGEVVGRIEVGKRPRGLRLTRDGKQLMIALSGS